MTSIRDQSSEDFQDPHDVHRGDPLDRPERPEQQGSEEEEPPKRPARPLDGVSFLSSHAHVLLCLARQPDMRLKDIARGLRITERSVHRILSALESQGLVERRRVGRCNHYSLSLDRPLKHPLERHRTVGELVQWMAEGRD